MLESLQTEVGVFIRDVLSSSNLFRRKTASTVLDLQLLVLVTKDVSLSQDLAKKDMRLRHGILKAADIVRRLSQSPRF